MFETVARDDLIAPDDVGKKTEFPCHICGCSSYAWGSLAAQGINFAPQDASILAKFFRFGTELPARRCNQCGNIQVFARMPKVEE
jgi:hypothetical protein